MAEQPPAAPDPFAMWREWVTQSERQWNAFLNEAMATEQFSQSLGRMMDVYLNMQKSMNEMMGRYFTALNMPTRTDVLSLGNRLSEIEERLASLETAVLALQPGALARATGAAPIPRPPRTRKPAKA